MSPANTPMIDYNLFINNEWAINVYCAYHNVKVKVIFNENNSPKRFKHKSKIKYCFLFIHDPMPKETKYKIMKFADFYKLVCNSKVEYFSHLFDQKNVWHKDAYPSFTKKELNRFLKTAKQKDKNKYKFLFPIKN